MTSPYNPEFQFTDWPDGPLNANLPPDPFSPNGVLNQVGAEFDNIATAFTDLPLAPLIGDTLDVDRTAYLQGAGRPVISLREAINALLAGRWPTTPELPVSPSPGGDVLHRAVVLDSTGGLVVVWQSSRVNNIGQVYAARLDLTDPDRGFSPAVPVTSGAAPNVNPTVVALPTGELIVAYTSQAADAVVMKRAPLANLPTAPAQVVAAKGGLPQAVRVGTRVIFFSHQASTRVWTYRRYDRNTAAFLDTAPVTLLPASSDNPELHAVVSANFSWVLYPDRSNLVAKWLGADGTVAPITSFAIDQVPTAPFVLPISLGEALVFYRTPADLRVASFRETGKVGADEVIPGTDSRDGQPAAVRETDGTIYLFHTRRVSAPGVTPDHTEIILRRWSPNPAQWNPPQRVTRHAASDQQPHPILVPGKGIWLIYQSTRNGQPDLYATRILTTI